MPCECTECIEYRAGTEAEENPPTFLTQKARSIMLPRITRQFSYTLKPRVIALATENLADEVEDGLAPWLASGLPFGVRFCPVNPNHGGAVDSEFNISVQRARELAEHAREVEPGGEVVIMSAIDADFNAILTPSGIVVGPGHDGATSGRGARLFPIAAPDLGWAQGVLRENEVAYVEAVRSGAGEDPVLVQARSGPFVPAAVRSVPSALTVTRIVHVTGETDMLTWGDQCKEFARDPGTVVVHEGGALSSHFGVHCILYGVPYLAEGPWPKVGERIPATGPARVEIDGSAAMAGFTQAWATPIHEASDAVHRVLFTAHNLGTLLTVRHGSTMLGAAVADMLRLGYALCAGEARHSTDEYSSREIVYDEVFMSGKCALDARERLPMFRACFEDYDWEESYGGSAWANITAAVQRLDRAAQSAIVSGDWTECGAELNEMVHLAHNSGWWLNKFVTSSTPDYVSAGRAETVLRAAMSWAEWFARPTVAEEDWAMDLGTRASIVGKECPDWTPGGRTRTRCDECGYYSCVCNDCDQCGYSKADGDCQCCQDCEQYSCECCPDCYEYPCGCPDEDDEDDDAPDVEVIKRSTRRRLQVRLDADGTHWQYGVKNDYSSMDTEDDLSTLKDHGVQVSSLATNSKTVYYLVTPTMTVPQEVIDRFGLEGYRA